jgi:azurin
MVNASRKPGEWQTYDILFERAKPGQKARLTVIHNGVVVHYLREFDSQAQGGDIFLQDHLNPVRFRNIWLRPLRVDSDKVAAKAEVKKAAAGPVKAIKIKTLTAQMKYDTDGFTVRPGEAISLTLENGDDLPHNIVFCQPGTDTMTMVLKQMENPEAALKREWVPEDKAIWLHSKMLNPHEEQTLEFAAPEKAGDYPFVCTFPGHALSMKGVMKVLPMGARRAALEHFERVAGALLERRRVKLRYRSRGRGEDTEREVRRLLEFCGLPFEPACLRFFENDRPVRTASSEQVRQPIYSDAVEHWKAFAPWLGPLEAALGDVATCYPAVPESLRP